MNFFASKIKTQVFECQKSLKTINSNSKSKITSLSDPPDESELEVDGPELELVVPELDVPELLVVPELLSVTDASDATVVAVAATAVLKKCLSNVNQNYVL